MSRRKPSVTVSDLITRQAAEDEDSGDYTHLIREQVTRKVTEEFDSQIGEEVERRMRAVAAALEGKLVLPEDER